MFVANQQQTGWQSNSVEVAYFVWESPFLSARSLARDERRDERTTMTTIGLVCFVLVQDSYAHEMNRITIGRVSYALGRRLADLGRPIEGATMRHKGRLSVRALKELPRHACMLESRAINQLCARVSAS